MHTVATNTQYTQLSYVLKLAISALNYTLTMRGIMGKQSDSIAITFKAPRALRDALKARAELEDTTLSQKLPEFMREWTGYEPKQLAFDELVAKAKAED